MINEHPVLGKLVTVAAVDCPSSNGMGLLSDLVTGGSGSSGFDVVQLVTFPIDR